MQRTVTVLAPAAVVSAVAWSNGGFFPRSFGWLLLLVAIGLAAVGILGDEIELGHGPVVLVGALLALAAWQIATIAWAVAPDAPPLEAERTLVYAGAAAVALLAVPGRRAPDLVVGVLAGAGAATVGGLLEHALGAGVPDDRLELPVGYPNATGILAATTLLLGLGLGTSGARFRRALGAGLAVPAGVALALSLSRGSILAAVVGLVLLGVTARSARELARVALTAVPAALAVALVWATGRLSDDGVRSREILALLGIAVLSLCAAALAAAGRPRAHVGREPSPSQPIRRAAVAAACAVSALALVAVGAHEARQSRSTPTTLAGAPDRLLSTSTSSRGDYWHVAAVMVDRHPFGGAGAGGFARVWLQERPALLFVLDAHNLYLETVAELGPLGLGLLLVALFAPFLAAGRAVRRATGRAALAAYVALLAHAALDWDWELPAVTLCAILLAVALLRSGAEDDARRLSPAGRTALLASATLVGALAIVVHAGNVATADANDRLDRGDGPRARSAAERARRFRPWAAEPWELIGEAELADGRAAQARDALRRATREDPGSWRAWLSLAVATTGSERAAALERARSLNPLAPELGALSGP